MSGISGVGVEMRGDHRFLSFLRNVRNENQRNAVKIDEKVGENKEKLGFVIRQYLFLSMRLKDEENTP